MGTAFPWSSHSRVPTGGSHHSYSVHVLHLAYIIVISLGRSKWVTAKICEIKSKKSTTLCQSSIAFNPAKRDAKRRQIELAMRDFRFKHCQLTARASSSFLFGNARLSCSRQGLPLHFAIRVNRVVQGLSPYGYVSY